jgi:hypothetical protein
MSWRDGAVLVECVAIVLLPLPDTNPAPPDVIYRNGVVLTMEGGLPRAEAIAVRNGRIVAVGDDDDVLALRKRPTRDVDLGGRTVLPGFIDSHGRRRPGQRRRTAAICSRSGNPPDLRAAQ